MDDKEPFLSRWSRRKIETKKYQPAGAADTAELRPAAAPAAPAMEPPAEVPISGTPEYREYFDPRIDETLRRTALKKLFSEPQFNVMDGLDTYIDDYSKPDPIPDAMLRQLNQAKDLFLFDEEKQVGGNAGDLDSGGAGAGAGDAAPAAAADTAALAEPSAAGACDEAAGAATNAALATPAEANKK